LSARAKRDEFSCPCCGTPTDSSYCAPCAAAECGEQDVGAPDKCLVPSPAVFAVVGAVNDVISFREDEQAAQVTAWLYNQDPFLEPGLADPDAPYRVERMPRDEAQRRLEVSP
jgi:hypothetical protein